MNLYKTETKIRRSNTKQKNIFNKKINQLYIKKYKLLKDSISVDQQN